MAIEHWTSWPELGVTTKSQRVGNAQSEPQGGHRPPLSQIRIFKPQLVGWVPPTEYLIAGKVVFLVGRIKVLVRQSNVDQDILVEIPLDQLWGARPGLSGKS